MDWITDRIAIGNFVDSTNVELLQEHAFRSILCLDCTVPPPKIEGLARHVVHLNDEPGNPLETFLRAVTTLERLAVESSPVFVHCYAGRSRSVIVLAAYFMRAHGCSPDEAIAQVAAKRLISITPGLEQLLYHI